MKRPASHTSFAGTVLATSLALAALTAQATTYILGGESNENNVGSSSSPVSWSDTANWTPAAVPGGTDNVNWAPNKSGSYRHAYVELDGDYEIAGMDVNYRAFHFYKASSATAPVTFTINTQLNNTGYSRCHEVCDGVKLVLPMASTFTCSKGDHDYSGIAVKSGGQAEIRGILESRVMKLEVEAGGTLLLAPKSYVISSWGRSDDDHDEINVNGGIASFPNGIAMTGTATTPNNQINQSGGTVTFGGNFTSEMPWTYTWSSGALNITHDCLFGNNIALVVPASSTVTLDVASGKTFSAPGLRVDSTATITKTGNGVFAFVPMSASVAVNAGGIKLETASTYDFSAVTFSSGTTVELAVLGATLDSFDSSLTANATFKADLSGANVGTVFSSSDATLLAKVKGDLEGAAGFPSDKQLTISDSALRLENKASEYSFVAGGEADILDAAGWGGSVPGAGEAVSITGATTVATFTNGTFPQWSSIEVRDSATLRISADADLPQITLYPNTKLEIVSGTISIANGLVGSFELVNNTVHLPVLSVATNSTLTVASGMKFKNVDMRLCGTVTKALLTDIGPTFGYADSGEVSYFAMTADGATFDIHSSDGEYNGNRENGKVCFLSPEAGGTVVAVGTVLLRNCTRSVFGWGDYGNTIFGQNNSTAAPFDVVLDGTSIEASAFVYISGAARLSLVNNSHISRHSSCLGHYFSQAIQDSATVDVGSGCYIDFTTGDGNFGIDSQSVVDTVAVRDGGVYAVSYNSSGWGLGVFVSDGGVLGVTKIYKSSSGDPRVRTNLLRGFGSARLDGDLAIASVNMGGGNYDWNRHTTMANIPFSGTGDVTITNGVPEYPFTVTMQNGANTATGTIKVAKAEGDAETKLYFANGANWAGTVVADGNVALTNLTDAADAVAVKFGTLQLDADFAIRVKKTGGQIVANDKVTADNFAGTGRLTFVAMDEPLERGDVIELGKVKSGANLPKVARNYKLILGEADEYDYCPVYAKYSLGMQIIFR